MYKRCLQALLSDAEGEICFRRSCVQDRLWVGEVGR